MLIFCSKGMEIRIRFPFLEYKFNLPPQFVSQAYFMHIISCLRKIGEERDKGLGLFIPARDQSQTKRLMLNEPLHVQLAASWNKETQAFVSLFTNLPQARYDMHKICLG